jgi:cell division protein FtsL
MSDVVATPGDETSALVTALQEEKRTLEAHVDLLQGRIEKHEDQRAHVADLQSQVAAQQQHGEELKSQHESAIYELRLQHEAASTVLERQLQARLDAKDALLRERDARLQAADKQQADLHQMLLSNGRIVEGLRAQVQEKDRQLPDLLAAAAAALQQEVTGLRAAVAEKDAKITSLETQVAPASRSTTVSTNATVVGAPAAECWPPAYVLPCPKCQVILVPGILPMSGVVCDGCKAPTVGPTKYLSCRACDLDLCVAKCVPKARPTCGKCPGDKRLQERVARPTHVCDVCRARSNDHAYYSCECNFDMCTACVARSAAALFKFGSSAATPARASRRGQNVTVGNFTAGARVQRGPSWKWGEQDGGAGRRGTLVRLDAADPGWCELRWDAGRTESYRCGHSDAHDLVYAD